MYNELIKRLRASVDGCYEKCDGCPYEEDYPCCVDCLDKMHNEAADALEELLSKLNHDDAQIQSLVEAAEERRWIPVTERLPKEEKEIYWCYTNMGIMCECRWTNNIFGVGESDKWGWNIMDVPQYQKVTHWMPLPEPPKEE